MKRNTNPKTPPGWQRVLSLGELCFRRVGGGVRVEQVSIGNIKRRWAIFDIRDGLWFQRDKTYRTWLEATTAADGGVE